MTTKTQMLSDGFNQPPPETGTHSLSSRKFQNQRVDETVPPPSISNEDAFRKGFEENHGTYLVAGAVYRRSLLSRVHWIVSTLFIATLLLGLCQTAVHSLDLALLFESVHWATLVLAVLCGTVVSYLIQERFTRIFTAFGKGLYTYSTIDEETAQELFELRNQKEKEKKFLTNAFKGLGLCTLIGFCVFLPALSVYNGKFFEPQKSSGILDGLPCIVWLPFKVNDENVVLTRTVIMFGEFYIAWTVVNLTFGYLLFNISVGHTVLFEFKVLALALKTFDKRARGRKSAITVQSTGEATKEYLKISMKEAILHHKYLLEIVDDYVEIFRVIILLYLLTNTVMICLSAVSLTSDIPLEGKTVFVIFTSAEICNTFVLSYYGQVLLDAHTLIRNALYECNWPKYSSVIGKYVIITFMRIQKPLSFTAGGFADVNLNTFCQVMKTSFSYFSLLQALK